MHKILSVGRHLTTYNVNLHSHDYWELVYCTNGAGVFASPDSGTTEYSKNELIIIPPGLKHENRSDNGFSNLHMLIDNIKLPENNFIKLSDNANRTLYNFFMQSHYFFNNNMANRNEVLSYLAELIKSCITTFLDTVFFSSAVEKIRSDIIKNFTDANFDLNNVLLLQDGSSEYYRKLFSKETNITPLRFLIDTRLNYAKKLLENKLTFGMNISEIALECGFKDSLYFSRLFKKYVGCSPNDYSKQSENNPDVLEFSSYSKPEEIE